MTLTKLPVEKLVRGNEISGHNGGRGQASRRAVESPYDQQIALMPVAFEEGPCSKLAE
jgi:hypothetical protein